MSEPASAPWRIAKVDSIPWVVAQWDGSRGYYRILGRFAQFSDACSAFAMGGNGPDWDSVSSGRSM